MSVLSFSTLGAVAVTAADIELVSFDGTGSSTKVWHETNDPVMGGQSTGSFAVEENALHWTGAVVDVPKLSAPGFIKVETAAPSWFQTGFQDISSCKALYIRARAETSYDGYRVSFGTKRDTSCSYFSSGFKTHFSVPVDKEEFHRIEIPLTAFSDCNSDSTGEPIKTCEANPSSCPDLDTLKDIKTIGLWGEGVAGRVDLFVDSIGATGCDVTDTVPTAKGRVRSLFSFRRQLQDDCSDGKPFYRLDDGHCSQTCLGKRLGFCPQSIIVKSGKLSNGACKDQGYTTVSSSVDGGVLTQKAGPCGSLTFSVFDSDPIVVDGRE